MQSCFILRPELKLIPEVSLAIYKKTKLHLNEEEKEILKESQNRPLFLNDLRRFHKNFIQNCFLKLPFSVKHPDDMADPESVLVPTIKKDAQYLKLDIASKTTVKWDKKTIILKKGEYIIPYFFPHQISGDCKRSYWKNKSLVELREEWFLSKIDKFRPKNVFELGVGRIPKLGLRIIHLFPKVVYQGWDKELDSTFIANKKFHKKDFLKSKFVKVTKAMFIAQEVIEHIPESKVTPLIAKIFQSGASNICLTTPNADFNTFVNLTKRRDDHHFEWTKKELNLWSKKIQKNFECSVTIETLGKNIKKVAPTWAITITKL